MLSVHPGRASLAGPAWPGPALGGLPTDLDTGCRRTLTLGPQNGIISFETVHKEGGWPASRRVFEFW